MRTRRLPPTEVPRAHAILSACGRDLRARLGLGHWDPPYPLDDMRADAAAREVYLVEDGRRAVATYTVGTKPIPDYPAALWTPDTEPALYLNRLAVKPKLQHRGLGRWCMTQIEERARTLGCRAVRFDGIAAHPSLRAFYVALGYAERGPFQIGPHPVVCFEKLLLT
jgi:GNAT superfamily N-acetyltransferase